MKLLHDRMKKQTDARTEPSVSFKSLCESTRAQDDEGGSLEEKRGNAAQQLGAN